MINTLGAGAEISSRRFTFPIRPRVPLSCVCLVHRFQMSNSMHIRVLPWVGVQPESSEAEGLEPMWGSVTDMKAKGESCLLTLGEPSGSGKTPGLPLSFSCL